MTKGIIFPSRWIVIDPVIESENQIIYIIGSKVIFKSSHPKILIRTSRSRVLSNQSEFGNLSHKSIRIN